MVDESTINIKEILMRPKSSQSLYQPHPLQKRSSSINKICTSPKLAVKRSYSALNSPCLIQKRNSLFLINNSSSDNFDKELLSSPEPELDIKLRSKRNTHSGASPSLARRNSFQSPLNTGYTQRMNLRSMSIQNDSIRPKISTSNSSSHLNNRNRSVSLAQKNLRLKNYSPGNSLCDDFSLLWCRKRSPYIRKNTLEDIKFNYSLFIKNWKCGRTDSFNATMAPKSTPILYASTYNSSLIHNEMELIYTRSADKCGGCDVDFYQQEPCLLHDNALWHFSCLKCIECNYNILPNMPILHLPAEKIVDKYSHERKLSHRLSIGTNVSKIICSHCLPKCSSCSSYISEQHALVLGKHFHQYCLSCEKCSVGLSYNTKVYSHNGKPCCSSCVSPLFNSNSNSSTAPLRSALSIDGDDEVDKISSKLMKSGSFGWDGYDYTCRTSKNLCRENAQKFSDISGMASALAYALSDQTEKNDIQLPETHRNFSENLNQFLSYCSGSLDRRQLKEKRKSTKGMHSFKDREIKPITKYRTNSPTTNMASKSLTSYNTVINSHEGRALILNYCTEHYEIEKIHFLNDINILMMSSIDQLETDLSIRKIVNLYLDLELESSMYIPLPSSILDHIMEAIKRENCPQDIFDCARKYVLENLEKTVIKSFLRSSYGSQYLKALISFDNRSRQVIRTINKNVANLPVEVTVIGFDKRHSTNDMKMGSKYYVYEIEVRISDYTFAVFRRYKEFSDLHTVLKKEFPNTKFPLFPNKIYIRSQVKSVAKERCLDLNNYLKELLNLSSEVSKHRYVLTFLKQSESDAIDEGFNKKFLCSSLPQ